MRKKTTSPTPEAPPEAAPPKPQFPPRPRFPRELDSGGVMELEDDIEISIIEAYREAVQAGEDWDEHYRRSFWYAFREGVGWHLEGRPIKDVSLMLDHRPLSLAAAVATAAALQDYLAEQMQRDAETALEASRTARPAQ